MCRDNPVNGGVMACTAALWRIGYPHVGDMWITTGVVSAFPTSDGLVDRFVTVALFETAKRGGTPPVNGVTWRNAPPKWTSQN